MRPSYVLPAALGRMARVGYSPKKEEPLTPLGGNFFYYPQRFGIANWAVNYTVTTGNLFVRLLFVHNSGPSVQIRVYFNGVEIPLLSMQEAEPEGKLGVATYGGKGFPIGAGTITVNTLGGDAGAAIMRVGELRNYTAIGATDSYGADYLVSALQISLHTAPGNDISMVCGVAGPTFSAIRPVSVQPYYPGSSNPPLIYPESVEVTELTSTDGTLRVVGWFGASTTQSLPLPSLYNGTLLTFRWNSPDPDFSYATCAVEVIGSTP